MLIRLNKFLSDSGVCSRRQADQHTLTGDIRINGIVLRELGIRIDLKKDIIRFKGEIVQPQENLVYYALYKPKGVVSTASDELGRQTVIDLVPKTPRVYPVGRLDEDSEGLIILTNDGGLTQELTHPSHEHQKEYEVTARITNNELSVSAEASPDGRIKNDIEKYIKQQFEAGIHIDGKLMKADRADVSKIHNSNYIIHVLLHTGYNRQIRKMCAKIGLIVENLKRTRIANLMLRNLKISSGQYVLVKKNEIL